jgi:hypothetical protein
MSLWESNCGATEKTCQGHQYIGGYNQCANGHAFWRHFTKDDFHPGVERVRLTGKVWTIDSWDGEHFTVEMKDASGNVLDSVTKQGNNFASMGDETLRCEDSVGGWDDGYYNIDLSAPYTRSMGKLEVRVTNTLDQGASDESIGVGDFKLVYDYDPSVEEVEKTWPTESPAMVDRDIPNPTEKWQSDCGMTAKECNGKTYFGGYGECAQGHSFWRVYKREEMHPSAFKVKLKGRIWTIDSWDGETFTVELKNQNGASLVSKTWTGNNFQNLGDWTGQCPNTAGHWNDGMHEIEVEAEISQMVTEIHASVTSTLD